MSSVVEHEISLCYIRTCFSAQLETLERKHEELEESEATLRQRLVALTEEQTAHAVDASQSVADLRAELVEKDKAMASRDCDIQQLKGTSFVLCIAITLV